jgi:hypothetical protein
MAERTLHLTVLVGSTRQGRFGPVVAKCGKPGPSGRIPVTPSASLPRFLAKWLGGGYRGGSLVSPRGSMRQGNVLEHIIKSLKPAALFVAGAVVFVLGTAFLIASDATLSPSSLGASSDLAQAGRWLQFLAAACVLGAVCTAGWQLVLRSEWAASAEVAAAAVGTLLLTIGLLASAASNGSGPAASVIGAVGIGIWALLVLSRAARVSLSEQGSVPGTVQGAMQGAAPGTQTTVPGIQGGRGRQADLWLAAAIGLFILAIGYGFTSAASSRGPGIAAGLLEAAGVAALAWSVAAARSRGLLHSRPVSSALTGLGLLAVSFLAAAVVAGLAFGTLSAMGTGLAVVTAVELAGVVALGLAAWTRVRELYR